MRTGSTFDPEALVGRIAQGDTSAEAELVDFYLKSLRLILRARYRDAELIQDVIQETFIAVIQNLRDGKLNEPAALAGYIRSVALNTANELLRKERKVLTARPKEFDRHAADDDVLASMELHELADLVREVIKDLKQARDRELIVRYYYYDIDKTVLCREFGITPEHFDRVNYRARERLKALVEERTAKKIPLSAATASLVAQVLGKEQQA